ncbi:DUF7573 domain-containing protein [Halorussus sp. AFM4]|uniref:DUF7573 domain-containing protein n=1 Tax=Halorussus sp. AFM4 TaxID=3421651 RepID=UPI003EBD1DFD
MTEDASLDRFASPDSPESEADAEPADDGRADAEQTAAGTDDSGADAGEPPAATEAAEPAVSTFGWSPGGGECAACGASVERRWRADGERGGDLVCADCKEW